MIKKLYSQKWIKFILDAVFSWLTAISISGVAGYRITEINMVIPFLMVGVLYVIAHFEKNREKRLCKPALCFALPFALTLVLGSGFDMDDRVFYGYSVLAPIYFIVLAIFILMLIVNVMAMLNQLSSVLSNTLKVSDADKNNTRKERLLWLGAFLCCLIAWMPYFLTYCPGIVSADHINIINQCLGNVPLTNHHPVLFVFFVRAILLPCKQIGGLQFAVAAVTFVQLVLFAAMLSYMAYWLYKKGIGKIGYGLTVAFIALNPVIAVFSVYMTKDVLFGGIFLLYILKLYEVVESKGEVLRTGKGIVSFLLLNLLVVLLRNNGIYITIIMLSVCCVLYCKVWKRILLCVAIIMVSYGLLKGPVFSALGIAGESFAEAMSVPLQQIAQTICDDGEMEPEDADFLEQLMPFERVKEVYRPGYTDPYKFDAAFDDEFLNENKGEFLKVWARILPRNLGSYVEAYLMQTAGYWHIGETDSLNAYGVMENTLGITQDNLIEKIAGISLEPIIEKLILACRKAPVICYMTNMAFMVFLVYFICIRCWKNGKRQYIIPFTPLLLLWVTIMVAAPAYCKFRYLFPYHLAYPVFIWVLLCVSGSPEKDNHIIVEK